MGIINWITKQFTPNTPVVFTILLSKDKGLLLKRGKTAPYAPGYWNFPGGHVDKNETIIEAARRECEEETGITPQNLTVLGKSFFDSKISYLKGYTNTTQVTLGKSWGILENDAYNWIHFEEIFHYKLSDNKDMIYYWHLAHNKEVPKDVIPNFKPEPETKPKQYKTFTDYLKDKKEKI